jgi:ATPase subunit of ABC transporter with duplicated ATPase domains
MLQASNISMLFSDGKLFEDVTLQFTPGNCYGVIGANGAGKSTFLKIVAGDIEPSTGQIIKDKKDRMSVLKQDHYAFNEFTVIETVFMGNKELYEVMKERDMLYSLTEFTEEQGMRMGEIEGEFAELGGYEAEGNAQRLLVGLGIPNEFHTMKMSDVEARVKVKAILAQCLFGDPDILIMDEPTNHLDMKAIN